MLSPKRTTRVYMVSAPPPPFEGLPDDEGSGFTCFFCRRSTIKIGHTVVVTRLWQVAPVGGEKSIDVMCATSSLQACIPCTLHAAVSQLTFKYSPKLVSPELSGFYCYARALAYGLDRSRSDTRVKGAIPNEGLFALPEHQVMPVLNMERHRNRGLGIVGEDQCYRCGRSIAPGSSHMLTEIAIHSSSRNGVGLSYVWHVGKHCHDCSVRLFPIDEDDCLDPDVW